MPTLLGILHGKYDTPHYGIWILVGISALLGAYGVLNVDNLTQITLASNTGTFLLVRPDKFNLPVGILPPSRCQYP